MKITVSTPMPEDYKSFDDVGLNSKLCLLDCVKLLCQDEEGHTAHAFLKQKDFEQFGLRYFEKYARLEYSKCCREWFMMCSKSPWYNDLKRFPETVIKVEFVGIENGTGREIYRGVETHHYYLREVLPRQKFAKWYVCGKRRMPDDGDDPNPNTIFQFGDQREKVVYDDWNGVAAYEYNENFRSDSL